MVDEVAELLCQSTTSHLSQPISLDGDAMLVSTVSEFLRKK